MPTKNRVSTLKKEKTHLFLYFLKKVLTFPINRVIMKTQQRRNPSAVSRKSLLKRPPSYQLRAVVFYGHEDFVFSNTKRIYVSRLQKQFQNNKFNSHKTTPFLSEVLTAVKVHLCCLNILYHILSIIAMKNTRKSVLFFNQDNFRFTNCTYKPTQKR